MSEKARRVLSDEESKQISREMVLAAKKALGDHVDPADMDASVVAKAIVGSIRSAIKARSECVSRFEHASPGFWISWNTTHAVDAVAAAFWWWTFEDGVLDEPPVAGCVGSTPYLAFARAMMATTLAGLGRSIIDDEDDLAFFEVENGSEEAFDL